MKKNEYIAPDNMKKKKFTCVSIRNEPNDIHANDHLAVGVCSFCIGVFSAIHCSINQNFNEVEMKYNPCKKCKHFVPEFLGRYAYYPAQCSRKVFREYNPVNGEWMSKGYLDVYDERMADNHECCGIKGKFFERKESFFKRIARAVHLLK